MLTLRDYACFSGYGAHKPHDGASVRLGVGSEPLSNNLGGSSERPYILAHRKSLPWQVEKKIEEKVQAIGSQVPIFVKLMTSNNVDGIGCKICEMVSLHTCLCTAANMALHLYYIARHITRG